MLCKLYFVKRQTHEKFIKYTVHDCVCRHGSCYEFFIIIIHGSHAANILQLTNGVQYATKNSYELRL